MASSMWIETTEAKAVISATRRIRLGGISTSSRPTANRYMNNHQGRLSPSLI